MTLAKAASKKKKIGLGVLHIQTTFNNTIASFTDSHGNVLCASSSGECGFKGKRKATPYAAQVVVNKVSEKVKAYGMTTMSVRIKGAGPQRELALRSVFEQGFLVSQIEDVSPMPHNGPRPRKRRKP